MINEEIISPSNKLGMSFFFSFIFLSIMISFIFGLIDMILSDNVKLNGTVHCYTSDSVYVDVKWEIEYSYFNLTEDEIKNIDSTVVHIMNINIPEITKKLDYVEYLSFKEEKYIMRTKNTKVEIFKE